MGSRLGADGRFTPHRSATSGPTLRDMSNNATRGDARAVRESQTNGSSDRPRPEAEDRYAVVPASFVVFDKHTGQTMQVYHGEDAEVRAQRHARHLHALKRRVADQNVVGERS